MASLWYLDNPSKVLDICTLKKSNNRPRFYLHIISNLLTLFYKYKEKLVILQSIGIIVIKK